jgi:hypothetical protein
MTAVCIRKMCKTRFGIIDKNYSGVSIREKRTNMRVV